MPDLQQRIYELVWAKVKDRSEVGKPWKLAADDPHTWMQSVTKHSIPRRSVPQATGASLPSLRRM